MPGNLTDEAAAFLYKSVIVPWESELKQRTGCWDVNRTRKKLIDTDIDLRCLGAGEIEIEMAKRTSRSKRDFVYFVGRGSQMQDLFRRLRNCAAHASIGFEVSPAKKPPRFTFKSTLDKKSELAISGNLEFNAMVMLVAALVTLPADSE